MSHYVQQLTYRKLPKGKKEYTQNVISDSPSDAIEALMEEKGNIEIVNKVTKIMTDPEFKDVDFTKLLTIE